MGFEVIETERGPIAPFPELILAPFSLVFSQIVALVAVAGVPERTKRRE
jgi:hypothetical protein